jgi:hypothetical protein
MLLLLVDHLYFILAFHLFLREMLRVRKFLTGLFPDLGISTVV